MSATAQCTKPKSEAATWTTLFDDVDTSTTKSVLFMKKLLALGVSNILFWRGLLPEAAFGERNVGENPLKILRNEKDCPAALKIISWIKASFEPIAKNWLRNFYLVIRDKENTTTIETYTFKFQYTEDEVETEIYRNNKKIPSNGVESKTMQMLSNISAVVKPLGPAPFPCTISIDMDFNQSSPAMEIPNDTVIPGFVPVVELAHKFDGKKLAVNLGDINTTHHDCKLQMRTTASRFNIERESEEKLQETDTQDQTDTQPGLSETQQTEGHFQSATEEPMPHPDNTTSISDHTAAVSVAISGVEAIKGKRGRRKSATRKRGSETEMREKILPSPVDMRTPSLAYEHQDTTRADTTRADTTRADTTRADTTRADTTRADTTRASEAQSDQCMKMTCPCKQECTESSVAACVRCGELQHMICYGFPSFVDSTFDTDLMTQNFLCFNCSPYLQELYEFSVSKFAKMCKVRQVLVTLDEDAEELDQSVINRDTDVRKRLIKEKIIAKNRKGKGYKLNQGALNKACEGYFDGLETVEIWSKPREVPTAKRLKRREH